MEAFSGSSLPAPDLSADGITSPAKIFYNPDYDELYLYETDDRLQGLERGVQTSTGTVAVDTGRFTGRSAKDKYIVDEPIAHKTVWWAGEHQPGSDNKPISMVTWDELEAIAIKRLNGKELYVIDGFCGANEDTRLSVRIICEVAWQAHFCKNMFIRPTEEELKNFKPDWTILNASKTECLSFEKIGLRSVVFAAFNIAQRKTLIGGTWYGGEMKKGIFTIMNYFLPLKGIGAFHCSANMGADGDTALFFGLSGTGKTTLSADPKRKLIGDDEHGWDDSGVFNFEGGCYAKTVDLTEEKEPDIFRAIKRDALLENVTIGRTGRVDYTDTSKTQNGRVSYPIHHIKNIVEPVSKGGHPKNIIFLTCDAFGVLPPVSKLTDDQAMYQYLSGYTAKVAGTELGVTEPTATFSACFGSPFLALHPTAYSDVLGKKMAEHRSKAYLVNTGWTGGAYGVGERMSLTATRAIIDAILDSSIEQCSFATLPIFNFAIPEALSGVDSELLNPRNTWADKSAYDEALQKLGGMFAENFERFTDTETGKALVAVGPQI
jgi:phosphoenolpyruvate carboxykinase (ATP)